MNINKICELSKANNGLGLIWDLQEIGALPKTYQCPSCQNPELKLTRNNSRVSVGYKWTCSKIDKRKAPGSSGRRCRYSKSLTSGTFFDHCHIGIYFICQFVITIEDTSYAFASTIEDTKSKDNRSLEALIGYLENVLWCQLRRETEQHFCR